MRSAFVVVLGLSALFILSSPRAGFAAEAVASAVAETPASSGPAGVRITAPPTVAPFASVSTAPNPARPIATSPAEPQTRAAPASFNSATGLMQWVYDYRKRPQPSRLPAAVHAMKDLGLLSDEEKSWFCTGFIAGILGDNPKLGSTLVAGMFPMPDKEQAVIIRAIVYSQRPDWRDLLDKFSPRMPLRRPLIDDFLNGKRPTLMKLSLEDGGTDGIYALWGYYVATGQHEPVVRIIQALRWSKKKDDGSFAWSKMFAGWGADPNQVDKVTTGGTAKWTLASYAERDRELLKLYRAEYDQEPEEIAQPLKDVIEAADAFESEQIRKDQLGAIDDAQKQQLSDDAGMSKGATAGSIAIATGCVAASVLAAPEIAAGCVIGGALYTGAAKLSH